MSLWLSRLLLARDPGAYPLHQSLWKAFPACEARPFLFRADPVEGRKVRVLVQSVREPDWRGLGKNVEDLAGPKRWQPALDAGRRFRFFLRANPTVSRKGRSEPRFDGVEGADFRARRGVRVGIGREEDRLVWLVQHGESCGFRMAGDPDRPSVRVSPPFVVQWRKDGRVARHLGVDFEGVLVVQDAEKLRAALPKGLGTAKAMGFGLLSLAEL